MLSNTSASASHRDEYGLPPRRVLLALWSAVWVAYGLWMLRAGPQASVDTTTYSRWADLLIANHFDVAAFVRAADFYIPPVLYLGWIFTVAALKHTFGASWMSAALALNWLAFGAGTYAVFTAIRRMTASGAGLLLAAMLLLVSGDLLIFIPFVLSDLIFWGMACTVLAAGCRLATGAPGQAGAVAIALAGTALVSIALFFRPGGLTLIIFWLAALASGFAPRLVDRFGAAIVAGIAAVAVIAVAWHAAIMADPRAWPFDGLHNYFAVLSSDYHNGVLVDAPESDLMVAPAVTWAGAVRLTTEKAFYFITPWLPSYSRFHTLINLVFFLPAYALAIVAVVNRARLSPAQRRALLILAVFVFTGIVSHALIQLDYDHRYRLPMLAALIMLAALGLESLRRAPRIA